MRKTFKYRVYANKQTLANAEHWLELCRTLYNVALQQRISVYKQNKGYISCYDQQRQLPDLKKFFPEYQIVNARCLQDVIERLDGAYRGFFRRIKNGSKAGFPRFKGNGRYNSFTLKQWGWKLDGKYLIVTKVGRFKLRLSRPIDGDIKSVILYRDGIGRWYVCFSCSSVPECKLPESDKEIGLDVGIKSFCVDSDGKKVENPLYFRQAEAILRRKQRRLSRRAKGSNRRSKARLLVAKCYEKISDQRKDFLHKTANQYIENYGTVFIEDLRIRNMVRNHYLSKSIRDSSWGKFFEYLFYKAEEAGRTVVKVNPSGTSQICSNCGEKVEKSLAELTHCCPYCGVVICRHVNAAKNTLQAGQACQASTKEVALCVA